MEPFHTDWFRQYKYDSFCMQSLQKELKYLKKQVTFETDDNCSIRFEMKKHYSCSTAEHVCPSSVLDISASVQRCSEQ